MSPAAASVAEAEADVKAEADVRTVEVQSLGGSITRICKMSCLVISGAAAIAVLRLALFELRLLQSVWKKPRSCYILLQVAHRHMCTVLVVFQANRRGGVVGTAELLLMLQLLSAFSDSRRWYTRRSGSVGVVLASRPRHRS